MVAYLTGLFAIIGKNFGAGWRLHLFTTHVDDCLAMGSAILVLSVSVTAFVVLLTWLIVGGRLPSTPMGRVEDFLCTLAWAFPFLLLLITVSVILAFTAPEGLAVIYGFFLALGTLAIGFLLWFLLSWERLGKNDRHRVETGKNRFWPWLLFRILVFLIAFFFAAGALGWLQGRDFINQESLASVALKNGKTYEQVSILDTQDGYLRFKLKGRETVMVIPSDQVIQIKNKQ